MHIHVYIIYIYIIHAHTYIHGAEAVAARWWSCSGGDTQDTGMRSPRKMVGEANLSLESNPISTRDSQRPQTNLCTPRPRNPTETEPATVLECLLWRTGQQWTAAGAGLWVQLTWHGITLLEEVTMKPTIELPQLT